MNVTQTMPYFVQMTAAPAGGWNLEIGDRGYRLIARVKLDRKLTDAQLLPLAHDGKAAGGRFYLYDSTCTPIYCPAENWPAYAERLRRLARIRIAFLPQGNRSGGDYDVEATGREFL